MERFGAEESEEQKKERGPRGRRGRTGRGTRKRHCLSPLETRKLWFRVANRQIFQGERDCRASYLRTDHRPPPVSSSSPRLSSRLPSHILPSPRSSTPLTTLFRFPYHYPLPLVLTRQPPARYEHGRALVRAASARTPL